MRDILITAIVFCSLPFILRSPVTGVLMWVWISVMNPHTQTWGFASRLPFAYLIAVVTLVSLVFSRQPKNLPITPISLTLIAFVLWMNVTTPFAIVPDATWIQWGKVMKIMLMTFITMMVIRERRDILRLIWVLVISLGYYGVKGGIFTVRSGGTQRVWGPEGTFIGDNNAVALALIIMIPLMHFLQQNTDSKWVRRALTATMLLTGLAALGSYSRGALLAIGAMCLFMWFKSSQKVAVGSLLVIVAPVFLAFMPDGWFARMDSISEYQADDSAQGRINAWRMAYNLACDRFLGGGFEISYYSIFQRYAPNPADVHAAHSIYFQALGEHGFVGLALYLLLGVLTWRSAAWIVRNTRGHAPLRWARDLVTMIQASMIGFAVGGAFLSLLYFDVPYYLMAAVIATRVLVERALSQPGATPVAAVDGPAARPGLALRP
ncbi:MAG: putative O-glycosylation ligase, exosortase A system-associated [Pseudomonadota bacterium]